MTIADRRADKTTDRVRTEQERKLTRLQHNKDKKQPKTDDNWVRNIPSRPLDQTETHVLCYGQTHLFRHAFFIIVVFIIVSLLLIVILGF